MIVTYQHKGLELYARKGDRSKWISTKINTVMAIFDPAHPGELIRETIEGLREETGQKLTIGEVAEGLGVTRKTLSAILNAKQSVTPEMAIRLATAFVNTTPEFWLNVQEKYDLAKARQTVDVSKIRVFWHPDAVSA